MNDLDDDQGLPDAAFTQDELDAGVQHLMRGRQVPQPEALSEPWYKRAPATRNRFGRVIMPEPTREALLDSYRRSGGDEFSSLMWFLLELDYSVGCIDAERLRAKIAQANSSQLAKLRSLLPMLVQGARSRFRYLSDLGDRWTTPLDPGSKKAFQLHGWLQFVRHDIEFISDEIEARQANLAGKSNNAHGTRSPVVRSDPQWRAKLRSADFNEFVDRTFFLEELGYSSESDLNENRLRTLLAGASAAQLDSLSALFRFPKDEFQADYLWPVTMRMPNRGSLSFEQYRAKRRRDALRISEEIELRRAPSQLSTR